MKFQCLHCGQHYEVEEKFAGQSCHCRTCGNVMKVPVPISEDKISVTDTVVISTAAIRQHNLRRKRHRYIRRFLLVVISLLIGLVLGVIGHIVIRTSDLDSSRTSAVTAGK